MASADREPGRLKPGKGAYRRLFLCLVVTACPVSVYADAACSAGKFDETARVKYVHDGDTVHLQDGRKLRLVGINAPELARDNRPAQAFAQAARKQLLSAIAADDNRVGLVYGSERRDHYGRTLAHLFTIDGQNLQALLLERGMAAAIAHPPNLAYTDCYQQRESSARDQGAGIWSDPALSATGVASLDSNTTGFMRIAGKIETISHTDKGVRITMDNLVLGISAENLAYFDLAELQSLHGKAVTVQGWVYPMKPQQQNKRFGDSWTTRFYMNVRHPSAIEIDRADNGPK